MVNEIKRPNYFRSQFLVENDFLDEQTYHRTMRQRHFLALHEWGVVGDGLQAQTTANPREITISPGVAVDKDGREIALTESRTETVTSGANTEIYLTVRYRDERLDADRYSGPGADAINNYIRITENPQFEFSSSQPDENSNNILLAQIRLDENGNIADINNSVRKYATSWIAPNATLPGPLNIGNALKVTGNSGTVLEIDSGTTNNLALSLNSSGSGWGSGIQFKNTATNAKTYGIYSGSDSKWHFADVNAGIDRLVVDKDGNVGIGTTNPGSSKLRISNSTSDFADISFSGSGMGQLEIIGWSSGWNINTKVNGNHLYLNRDSFENSNVYIGRVGQELFVRGRDGKVGIGTTNPSQKLTIQADYDAANDDAKQLLIQGNTNSNNQLELGYHTTKNYGSIQAVTQGQSFPFISQIARNLVLNPIGGNVGIGTTNPAGSLDVQGSVYIGTGRNGENHKLAIRGPNQPGNSNSFQDLSYEFVGAGSVRIRAFRGGSWDTYLQFLTNSVNAGRDNPQVSLQINHNGNVGIGTTEPTGRLTVVGSEGAGRSITLDNREIKFRGDGLAHFSIFANRRGSSLTIENTSSGAFPNVAGTLLMALNSSGLLEVRGDVTENSQFSSSDVRWKKNIEAIASALDKVLQLRGVTFEWRKEEYQEMNFNRGKHLGLIAQEVEQVIPEVVHQNEEGYKSLAYSNLVALLIEAIKELQAKHENLLPTMQAQQSEIEALKAEVNSLKALLIAQPV